MSENPSAAETIRPADPCALVIFGGAGDLTRRKLVPALYDLRVKGHLPKQFAVIGIARREMTHEAYREQLGEAMKQFVPGAVDDAVWREFASSFYYLRGDFGDADLYRRLNTLLAEAAAAHQTGGNCLFYLATPPAAFGTIVRQAGEAGLAGEGEDRWRRFIIEKPFGRDLASALALNEEITRILNETQIYRIDHYLGKETVQNILVLRFANGILEPIWNRRYVDHVQLLVAESIGVEGRGAFYESAGTLRDMIQNHMFQLLSLVAMEPPISFSASAVRNEKVKVLQAIPAMTPEEVLQRTVRGQYGPGFVDGARVAGYRAEPDVAPASRTETYGALQLFVENWRWAGVPFYLRAGKRLARRRTQIVIQFRRAPLLLFDRMGMGQVEPNRLILEIQPQEGILMQFEAKVPGPGVRTNSIRLSFNYAELGQGSGATGYETLLYDCMTGDSTLFHRADMVEAAWRIADPILDVWGTLAPRDFPNYASGSWGPPAADGLIERDHRRWMQPD